MNYQQALDWLDRLASEKKFFHDKRPPSLDEVNRALDLLGRPDKTFEYRVVVGGTAGKGTTCRYTEQTLLAAGKSVALLSSPHLQVVNERIRLNGRLIGREDFGGAITRLRVLIDEHGLALTFYEVIVLAGILAAAEQGVKVLICEVGMGGELDAVNAVQGSRIAALTFVGEDHLEMFGHSIQKLAKAKAGIFTKDSILNLSYEQNLCSILNKISSSKILYLKGVKQKLNKKLARKMCEKILGNSDFIMAKPALPCRWEIISDYRSIGASEQYGKIVLDGAHSEPRFEYLLETKLKKQPGPYTLVLGMQQNHHPSAFKLLLPYAARVIWTQLDDRAHRAESLKNEHGVGEVIESPLEALKKTQEHDEPVLVTGSFYLCGALRECFYPTERMLDQQTEFPE